MPKDTHSEAFADFDRALKSYLRYNKRGLGSLVENRSKKLQWELYRQFKATAPSKEKIEMEARAQGYAIKRRKGSDGKRLTVKQELTLRKRSIGWLSVSFLFKAWRANRDGQSASYAAKSRRNRKIGRALIRTAQGQRRPYVRLSSFLEGVVVQNRRQRIADKALRAQAADMRIYIARKQREQWERAFTRIGKATVQLFR